MTPEKLDTYQRSLPPIVRPSKRAPLHLPAEERREAWLWLGALLVTLGLYVLNLALGGAP